MKKKKITMAEAETLAELCRYEKNGVAPHIEEIATRRGLTTAAIYYHIRHLEVKGYVKRDRDKKRSIKILREAPDFIGIDGNLETKKKRRPKKWKKLTISQMKVLIEICSVIREEGRPPSMDELAKRLGMTRAGAHDTIKRLTQKGYITREIRRPRSIVVLKGIADMGVGKGEGENSEEE